VAEQVRSTGADLLLVALGCPKQELFLQQHLARTGCKVGIGVGGSFDFVIGRIPRAAPWVQRIGMEWAYRLAQEPSRLAKRYWGDLVHLTRLVAKLALGRPAV
jgi:exopolysaccharide biosynthesis WecB/TagA/CpsF family protein